MWWNGHAVLTPRVFPPRPRRSTSDSTSSRWIKPYDLPVESESDRMLSPAMYRSRRSTINAERSSPEILRPLPKPAIALIPPRKCVHFVRVRRQNVPWSWMLAQMLGVAKLILTPVVPTVFNDCTPALCSHMRTCSRCYASEIKSL